MDVRLVAAVAVAGALSLSAAHADPPTTGPDGWKCGLAATADRPTGATVDSVDGVLATPLLLATHPGHFLQEAFADGTVTCTIQAGDAGAIHGTTSNDLLTHSGSGNFVVAGAARATFTTADPELYVCTSFEYSTGERFYWTGGTGTWSPDSTVPCDPVTRVATGPSSAVYYLVPDACAGHPTCAPD